MVISKLIKDNKGGVYQISRTVMCFLINHMFTDRNQTTTNATCKNVIIVHNAIPGKNNYTTEFISRWVKAIGRSGIIFACGVERKVLFAGVSTLSTEVRYLATREKYWNLNFRASILSYSKTSWKNASKISCLEL